MSSDQKFSTEQQMVILKLLLVVLDNIGPCRVTYIQANGG